MHYRLPSAFSLIMKERQIKKMRKNVFSQMRVLIRKADVDSLTLDSKNLKIHAVELYLLKGTLQVDFELLPAREEVLGNALIVRLPKGLRTGQEVRCRSCVLSKTCMACTMACHVHTHVFKHVMSMHGADYCWGQIHHPVRQLCPAVARASADRWRQAPLPLHPMPGDPCEDPLPLPGTEYVYIAIRTPPAGEIRLLLLSLTHCLTCEKYYVALLTGHTGSEDDVQCCCACP